MILIVLSIEWLSTGQPTLLSNVLSTSPNNLSIDLELKWPLSENFQLFFQAYMQFMIHNHGNNSNDHIFVTSHKFPPNYILFNNSVQKEKEPTQTKYFKHNINGTYPNNRQCNKCIMYSVCYSNEQIKFY